MAAGCGCLGILLLLVVGLIGSAIDGDNSSAKAATCPTVTVKGMPAKQQQVTVATAGKAKCDDDTRVVPFTATSTADAPVSVTFTLRLTAPGGGHELGPVFVREEVPAGGTVKGTADVRPWGHIDGAAKLTATVTEFVVGKPDPAPTGDGGDLNAPDVDRPHRCHHKWYC